KMTDRGDNDFKILAVPNTDPLFREYDDLWRIPSHFLREVEHFFATYKELEGNKGEDLVQTQGWESAEAARNEIVKSVDMYNRKHGLPTLEPQIKKKHFTPSELPAKPEGYVELTPTAFPTPVTVASD